MKQTHSKQLLLLTTLLLILTLLHMPQTLAHDFCASTVRDLEASCSEGSLTADTYSGNCRTVECTSSEGSLKIKACNKPDGNTQYFEMYRRSASGNNPAVCLSGICMDDEGYIKSPDYPICYEHEGAECGDNEISGDEQCDDGNTQSGDGCSATCQIETPTNPICGNGVVEQGESCDLGASNGACPSTCSNSCTINECVSVQCTEELVELPVSCTGGSIISDTYNGCRTVICSEGGQSLEILACNKPGNNNPQYFEMYRKSATGNSIEICLADTCIQNEGYAKSPDYPICTSGNGDGDGNDGGDNPDPTDPICGNGILEEGEECDSSAPQGYTCTIQCTLEENAQQQCYETVEYMPVTCNSGTITQDSYNGCRTVRCESISGTNEILACNKPGNHDIQYFEMYKKSATGTIPQICLGDICMTNEGYVKSDNFPICTSGNGNGDGNDGGDTGDGGSSTVAWIEPVQNQQNTPPHYFHLNVQVPADAANIVSTDWEVWTQDMSARVWEAYGNIGNIKYHTHTPDGQFVGPLVGQDRLNYLSTYNVRMRYRYADGTVSDWSSTRTFTTHEEFIGNNDLWQLPAGFQIERVGTGFSFPVSIEFAPEGMYGSLPDNQEPDYYVTELYGKVKVIHKDGSVATYADGLLNFDPFGSITGGGQMGVVGLYVDDNTGDLFVGMVYVEGEDVKNKVVRFHSTNDGNGYTSSQVLIDNLPSSPSHQIQTLTKGPDGKLYVQLGDALDSSNAQNDGILAGKIIRMNLDGSNVETYAKGFRNPFGGAWRPGTDQLFVTDNSPNTNDRLLKITQGMNYLWGTGTNDYVGLAIDLLNPSPVDVEFNPSNGAFPDEYDGRMYVAVAGPVFAEGPTNGKEILEYQLDTAGNIISKRTFLRYTGTGFGTIIGMDFSDDGLYFTDIYGEAGTFNPPEGNIYKISPGNGGCINCQGGGFRAGIAIKPWYPKLNGDTVEYIFKCDGIDGSGNYRFQMSDYGTPSDANAQPNDGNGYSEFRVYAYEDQEHTVACTVKDQNTGELTSVTMTVNPSDFIDDGVN